MSHRRIARLPRGLRERVTIGRGCSAIETGADRIHRILRALYAVNAVRAGLYGAAASAYGDAFAQASRQASDPTMRHVSRQLAAAYTEQGRQLEGYSRRSAALATKRFKASLDLPNFVFMMTKAPEGK